VAPPPDYPLEPDVPPPVGSEDLPWWGVLLGIVVLGALVALAWLGAV
jgi:hypothetical protein